MRGYKDIWFDEYEKAYNEREERRDEARSRGLKPPKEDDMQLAEQAHEAAIDRIADAADRAKDRRKYGE